MPCDVEMLNYDLGFEIAQKIALVNDFQIFYLKLYFKLHR